MVEYSDYSVTINFTTKMSKTQAIKRKLFKFCCKTNQKQENGDGDQK